MLKDKLHIWRWVESSWRNRRVNGRAYQIPGQFNRLKPPLEGPCQLRSDPSIRQWCERGILRGYLVSSVVINPCVLSANRVDLCFFLFHKFSNFTPPHPADLPSNMRVKASRLFAVVIYSLPRLLPVVCWGGGVMMVREVKTYINNNNNKTLNGVLPGGVGRVCQYLLEGLIKTQAQIHVHCINNSAYT